MELFSLLAKLVLDSKDFDKELESAQSKASGFDVPEPSLGLDDDEFTSKIADAQDETIEDQEPTLGLDKEEFDKGIEDVEEKSGTFSSSIKSIFEELKGALVATGVVAAVTTVVGTLKEGIELAGKHGDMIDKQSQKMNISAKAYQEWNYALGLSGASIDDLNRGLRTWQQSVGDEKKTAELGEAFTKLGIDAEKAMKQIADGGNLDSLLDQVMYGLADMDSGERGALAETLFGRGANGLNALFNATSEDIQDMKKEAEDLGLVMTDEEVKNAAAYTDAVSRLEQSVQAFKESIAAGLMPIVTDITNGLAKLVAVFNWRGKTDTLGEVLENIDKEGASAIKSMEQDEAQAKSLIDTLADMGDYWTLDDNGKKTWNVLADELIKIFPQLDVVIGNNKNALYENRDAIKANIEEWTKLEEQRLLDQNLADKRQAIAEQYAKALDKEIEAELKESEADGKRATAIQRVNDLLQSTDKQYEQFQREFEEKFGEGGVTTENFKEVQDWFRQNYSPFDMTAVTEMRDWEELNNQAETLRDNADQMSQEADEASENYTQYAEKLAEKLGITIDDTQTATEEAEKLKNSIDAIPDYKRITIMEEKMNSHAIGSAYIPWDNYPAILHRGEKVLTATEARQGSGESVDYGALENAIVAAIENGMSNVHVDAYMDGKRITSETNRNNRNTALAGRFRT